MEGVSDVEQGRSQQRVTKKSQVSPSVLLPPPHGGGGRGKGQVPCTTGPRQPEAEPATEEQNRAKSLRPGSRTGLAPGPSD